MYNNYLKQYQNARSPQMPQTTQIPQAFTPMPRMQAQSGYPMPQMMPQAIMQQGGQFVLPQNAQPLAQAGGQPTAPSQEPPVQPTELRRQAEEFSRKNPEFQLEKEIENPQFCKYILENKLTVEEAYTLTHREELMGKAKAEALEDFRAKRDRISENGTGRTSGGVIKMNPKDMDDKDIAAIIERVRKGEKISF